MVVIVTEMVDGLQQEGHRVLLQKQTNTNWISTTNAQNMDWQLYRQVTEQRLGDQANQIWKKGWFSQAELEEIKQRSSTPAQSEDKSTHNAANVIHNQEQVN